MLQAQLHIDMCEPSWAAAGSTIGIVVDPTVHVFFRKGIRFEYRGVFAWYGAQRIMLLRAASERFYWDRLCPVSVVVPEQGEWPEEQPLEEVWLEDVAKAIVEVSQGGVA